MCYAMLEFLPRFLVERVNGSCGFKGAPFLSSFFYHVVSFITVWEVISFITVWEVVSFITVWEVVSLCSLM